MKAKEQIVDGSMQPEAYKKEAENSASQVSQ
jgi:hypothetical protein